MSRMSGGEAATETLTDSLKRKTGPGTAGGTGREKKPKTGAGTAAGTGIGAAIMTVGMTALKVMTGTAGNGRRHLYSAIKVLQAHLRVVYQIIPGSLCSMTDVAKGAQELNLGKTDGMLHACCPAVRAACMAALTLDGMCFRYR